MKTKQLITWGGVLLAVVAIIIVGERLSNMRPAEKSLRFFPAFSESSCSKIVISKGADTVYLVRDGASYKLQLAALAAAVPTNPLMGETPPLGGTAKTVAVDSAALQTALEKLGTIKKEILSSNNIDKQSVFQVDSASGTRVEVFNNEGASMGAVFIGKNGPDWTTNFVRAIGSNEIYTVGGNPANAFFADKKRWRDKVIIKFDRSLPVKITLKKKSGDLIVLQKSTDSATAGSWNLASPQSGPAKADAVTSLISALSVFNASDWEESGNISRDSLGFGTPELHVVVELQGGATRELTIGNKNVSGNQFFVSTPGKSEIFLVEAYTVQALDKGAADFIGGASGPTVSADMSQPLQMPMPVQMQ